MKQYQLPIHLLIADDHQLIIDGLSRILETKKMIGSIHSAHNGREAVDKALSMNIDCVMMDLNMPVLGGLEATRLIKQDRPWIKIIVVSMICDAPIVHKLMKAGADAFVNKDIGQEELVTAIDKVMNDEKYISPDISVKLFAQPRERNQGNSEDEKHLTPREIEIIRFIADGFTNAEIAEKLFLSSVTVDTHRKNILSKLQLKNTATLVKYAVENKLL